jgi:predicted MPP superfamily phosphohydrolase
MRAKSSGIGSKSRERRFIPGLPQAFDGFRVAQLSDIHMDELH